jgi:hypothetical protein
MSGCRTGCEQLKSWESICTPAAVFGGWREIAPEEIVMVAIALTAEQEREAKILEGKIRLAIDKEVTAMARLLASREDKDLFGKTEFEVRDLVLKIGAKAYEELLREKKTATTDRE